MLRLSFVTAIGLLLLAGCAQTVPPPVTVQRVEATQDPAITAELANLRAALEQEVPQHTTQTAQTDRDWIARASAAAAAGGLAIDAPQLVVVVDRAPAVQELAILLAQPHAPWQVVGGSKVSTGQAGRRGYFITPTGVFLHTDAIRDYRALGTYNQNHIRGLGVKGMRVWDFGWQTAQKGWVDEPDTAEIRLLIHATDPDVLEQRLGRPASQGCVRIPATMNRFLDVYGVLDADIARAAIDDPRFAALLLAERTPTPLAGRALIVLDSQQAPLPSTPVAAATRAGDARPRGC